MTLLKRLRDEARKEYVYHSPEIGDYIQNLDHPDDINDLIANTVTAVLDEVEREVEDKINSLGNLTESYNEGTYEGLMTTKKIIKSKRTEI
jgi:hypothetical protein